jgi:uncharacterized protein (UPF0276 family)
MKLAINYSMAAARLVQSGRIDIDYFKTPNWDWMVAEAGKLRPVAIHFNLEAGNANLNEVNWDKAEQQLRLTRTPFINLHLDARQCYYPDFQTDTEIPSEVEVVARTVISDVQRVVDRFGRERVIIENSPYQGIAGNTMQLCIQPDLIKRVIEETGCGLLLDISHAIITAKYLGIDPSEYISYLPVREIKEMHFAGIHQNNITGLLTDHLSIQDEDWHWLDWAMSCIKTGEWSPPWLLAFEYGGIGEPFEWRSNPEVIAEQVPKLYQHTQYLEV